MKTIGFISHLRGLFYCPLCRKVYYQLEECECDNKPTPIPLPVSNEEFERLVKKSQEEETK